MKSFWTRKQELVFYDDPTKQGYTEVIEYSAYESLRTERDTQVMLNNALNAQNVKLTKERDAYREALEEIKTVPTENNADKYPEDDHMTKTAALEGVITFAREVLAKYPKKEDT